MERLDAMLLLTACHGSGELVEALIAEGAQVNAQNKDGETPLILTVLCAAAFNGRPRWRFLGIISALLEKGADLNPKDRTGRTALDWALVLGQEDIAALLLERGAALSSSIN